MKKLLKKLQFFSLIFFLVILLNILLNKNIFVSKYQINSKKIPYEFDNYKIVQITDVHSIRNKEQKLKIVEKVKKESPDLIFITGDLIDSNYYIEENEKYKNHEIDFPDKITYEFVAELTDIADVYYVYGNHEMMLLDDPENNIFKVKLEEAGVKILNNGIDEIKINKSSVNIIGIQDPATLYKDKKYAHIEKNIEKIKKIIDDLSINISDKYNIALSHRPEYFELYSKYNIDLIFSGHAHGGIIRIPFVCGLYTHAQGWFPNYTNGIYEKNNTYMIVGRGIGYSKINIRVFNPPEIVSVRLKKNN